jgi:hypothetical protein
MAKKKTIAKAADALPSFKDGREFDALSVADKEKVWNSYNREIPLSETRPLNSAERATFNRIRRKAGRPRVGQGAKVVAVTLEKGFLERVDSYAKQHNLKRAEMITKGLRIVIGEAKLAH